MKLFALEDVKPGVTLEGVHPLLFPVRLASYGVHVAVAGRRPLVTGAAADRTGDEDDPKTLHDNGLALDYRARDLDPKTRAALAKALAVALLPLGCDVVGPYDADGHIHVELDPRRLAAVTAFTLVGVLLVKGGAV